MTTAFVDLVLVVMSAWAVRLTNIVYGITQRKGRAEISDKGIYGIPNSYVIVQFLLDQF